MLLVGSRVGKLEYVAIWCEQRDDFLCELPDKRFDAVQVKTATPENGPWEVHNEPFCKSVKRFVALDQEFPGHIRFFHFYSNVDVFDTKVVVRLNRCIPKLLKAVVDAPDLASLDGQLGGTMLITLLTRVNALPGAQVTAQALFEVLKRVIIQKGPSREEFHDVLCQSHLPQMPECKSASARKLSEMAKALVARVWSASSLQVDGGQRHYVSLLVASGQTYPELLAKRLSVEDVELTISLYADSVFRYSESISILQLGEQREEAEDSRRLRLKMERAGIEVYGRIIHRQAISAERRLLDLTTRTESGDEVRSQLEGVVSAECGLAQVTAMLGPEPYGKQMLIEVSGRLRQVANEEPARVMDEGFDMLMGVAGLLTGQCQIWWGSEFNLDPTP